MEEKGNHNEIMRSLGKLEATTSGINIHLSQLNGAVAKHEGQLQHMAIEDSKLSLYLETIKASQAQEKSFRGKWSDRILMLVFMGILQGLLLLFIRSGILNLEQTPTTSAGIEQKVIDLKAQAEKLQVNQDTIKTDTSK